MRLGRGKESALDGAFVQCVNCKKTHFRREFEEDLLVCAHCGHHHRLTWQQRLDFTFDEDSFEEQDAGLVSVDSLQFPDYGQKLQGAMAKTGLNDSVVAGFAALDGVRLSVAVADFSFMGGSMGSVAGEKIARTLERAASCRIPAVIFCASGGARMQEGLLSLMQVAKTTAAVGKCREAGTPYISVLADPTMAGVLASYASVADVVLAEPRAQVGFAGARVAAQAQVVKVPDDFQKAEFAHRSGMVDKVVERRAMRSTLSSLVRLLGGAA